MSNKYKIPNVTKYIQRRIDSLFSAIKKFIGSFNRWFSKENKNELSKYLEIFCENNRKYLDESMLKFLEDICDSTSSIYKRFKVISDPKCKSFNKKSERTFKIRVLLGVI